MRIALVSQEYPPETAKGGLGTQTYAKAHGLASLGHEVHVLSRSRTGLRSERKDGLVHVTRIAGLEPRMRVYTEAADWLGYSAEVAVELASMHERSPIDLVDFPEWGAEGFVFMLNQSRWNRIPTVLHLHGPLVMLANTVGWPDTSSEFFRTGSMMEQSCVRLADAVYSSSRCSAEWASRHYGRDLTGIPVIHMGIDTQEFAPGRAPKSDHPTVVFTGKLARNKGVVLLAEACSRLVPEFPGLRLRLLGRGEPDVIAELHAVATQNGAEDLLEIPGFIPHDQLPRELCGAHVFAAPSTYEGGPGFACLEAMACGLPVVACAGSGVADVVQSGLTGQLVPPEDMPALESALRVLLADTSKADAVGARGRDYILAEADSTACLAALESFYQSVLDAGSGSPAADAMPQ